MATSSNQRTISVWYMPVLLLVLVVLVAVWFFRTYHLVTIKDKVTPSREAKTNAYYASQLYLEKLGKSVETQKGRDVLLNLPSVDDVIVVKDIGHSFNDKRIDDMVAWLNQGGHIVTFADNKKSFGEAEDDDDEKASMHRGNRLLAYFGIYAADISDIQDSELAEEEDVTDETSADDSAESDEVNENTETVATSTDHALTETDVKDTDTEQAESEQDISLVAEAEKKEPSQQATEKGAQEIVKEYSLETETETETEPNALDESGNSDVADDSSESDLPESIEDMLGKLNEIQKAKEVTFRLDKRNVTVRFDEYTGLVVPKDANVVSRQVVVDADGFQQVYMVEVGFENQGRLTVLTQDDFIKNPLPKIKKGDLFSNIKELLNRQTTAINEVDNAFLLWHVVKDDKKVWLLPSIDAPSLTALLWQRARYATISFAVLLLAWLLWQTGRFGPIRAHVFRSRRNILEHLGMIGDFAWRVDKAEQLFANNRALVKAQCEQTHPVLMHVDEATFSETLSNIIDMPSDDIRRALFSTWRNESTFIEYSYLLQTLREKL